MSIQEQHRYSASLAPGRIIRSGFSADSGSRTHHIGETGRIPRPAKVPGQTVRDTAETRQHSRSVGTSPMQDYPFYGQVGTVIHALAFFGHVDCLSLLLGDHSVHAH